MQAVVQLSWSCQVQTRQADAAMHIADKCNTFSMTTMNDGRLRYAQIHAMEPISLCIRIITMIFE